jgi:hypothetical protein
MSDSWDAPGRPRLFLAAALAVAAAGVVVETGREAPDVERWTSVDAGAAESWGNGGTGASAREETDEAAGIAESDPVRELFVARGEALRDALADRMSAAQQASRTAAFAAPAGRFAGELATAAAERAGAVGAARRVGEAFAAEAPPERRLAAAGGEEGEWTGGQEGGSSAQAPGRKESSNIAAAAPRGGAARAAAAAAPPPLNTNADRLLYDSSTWRRSARTTAAGPQAKARRQGGPRTPRLRKLRPALLSRVLGRGALRAPRGVKLPKLDPWKTPIPAAGPDGRPLSTRPLGFEAAEDAVSPPACRRKKAHWEAGGEAYHEAELRGRAAQEGWSWAARADGRWWLWPEPERGPLLRHQGHWWLQSRELWFLLHDGAPWGARYLGEWGQLGFVDPSGAQMIYSADGTRVGMIEPGVGAIVYDARTGRELGRWSADQLPRRAGPKAPASLPAFP